MRSVPNRRFEILRRAIHLSNRPLIRALPVIGLAALAGCFYPALNQPPPQARTQVVLPVAYDLAWDAVNSVIKSNHYTVGAKDPNHGIIEATGRSFTSAEADCGQIRSVGGRYAVEPAADSSAVFNFHVKALSDESSSVSVQATFNSPLRVPLHPVRDETCISRGVDEARLLAEVRSEAAKVHRPVFRPPSG